jgi:hypothetical protein
MSPQAEEQVRKRRLMEEVPREPGDPREGDEDEDEERGGRVGQRAELGGERR